MIPSRLGPYTIRSRLGRGGMGTVYEAADEAGTPVAVKTLTSHLAGDQAARRRFDGEIAALMSLRHPAIVGLLAFGEEEGQPFFAMELVRGRSLEEILKDGRRFDWRETVAVAGEIARALKAAHDQGIIHRDLKPANLLFPDDPGTAARVKLADFGIARLFGDSGLTQAGTVVGTAEYMAPEQAAGERVDARVDLYALGLVMFAMITGRPPFRGGSLSDVLRRQRQETPPRVSAIVPDVPPSLDDLVARLLAKPPAERPASALAVVNLLASVDVEASAGHGSPAAATAADQRPTAPHTVPPRRPPVDLLAATRELTADAVIRPTLVAEGPTAGARGDLAHRPTEPDAGPTPAGDLRPASRFTTVDALRHAAEEAADRSARREAVLRAVVATCLLAVVLMGGYAVLRPATADQLLERIVAITEDQAADRRDAEPLVEQFLKRFPGDPRAARVRALEQEFDLDSLERRARRRPRDGRALSAIERDYRAAMDRDSESPLACLAALEAILALHEAGGSTSADPPADAESGLWLDLVRRQITRLGPLAEREREEDVARARETLAEAGSLAEEAAATADDAGRAELLARRRELLEGLVAMYADRAHVAAAASEAARLLEADGRPPSPTAEPRP